MFEKIDTYIQKPKAERQEHLDLSQSCIEIGGYDSREYRGLLAHYLKTEIPTGKKGKIALCHACGNHSCSNVHHLYWGTYSENTKDAQEHGTIPIKKKRVVKPISEIKSETERKIDLIKSMDRSTYGWVQRAVKLTGYSHTNIHRICERHNLERYQRSENRIV